MTLSRRRLPDIRLHLYDILEKLKLQERRTDQVLQELGWVVRGWEVGHEGA